MSSMRILACFRVTPDYEALRESAWGAAAERDPSSGGGAGAGRGASAGSRSGADPVAFVDTRYVRRILDCFDESALELALRLSDALVGLGGTAGLGAVSVGAADAEPHLKTLLALGFEASPKMGEVLRSVLHLKLNGVVASRDEELAAAARLRA